MKKLSVITFLTLTMVFLNIRCSENFLTPKPLSFYAPENTFVDAKSLNSVLIACIAKTRSEYYGDTNPFNSEAVFSDIAVSGSTDETNVQMDLPVQVLPDVPMDTKNHTLGRFWTDGYKRIQYANLVIARIDDAKWKNEAERNDILGKAYFHRAHVYYRLVHQYGDVPLVLDEIKEAKLDFYSCTRESILEKCKKDLEFAAKWVNIDNPIGDVNKAAVNHLLTKVYLSLGLFDLGIASANAVINDGVHALMTTRFGVDKNDPTHDIIWDLHQEANKALPENKERIWLFVSSESLTEDGASLKLAVMRQTTPFWGGAGKIKTPTGQAGTSDQPLGAKVSGYPVEIDLVGKYGRGIAKIRPSDYSQFSLWDDANDRRHKFPNWIRMENLVYNNPVLKSLGDAYYGKSLQLFDNTGGILCSDTIRSWFNWPAYKLFIADPTNPMPQGGYGDWYCYRLAETYLLRAEAYFWKGDLLNAAKDINAVRTRAGCGSYALSQINIGTILDERARELYYEEPRKTELTRIAYILAKTGKPSYNGKTYNLADFSTNNFWYDRVIEKNKFYREQTWAPFHNYRVAPWIVLWPISSDAINANSLGHINQNLGYKGSESNITPLKWVDGPGEGSIVKQ